MAFAHIRGRNHHLSPDIAKGIENLLVAHGIAFEITSQHRLKSRFLVAIHKMLVNIYCHTPNARIARRKFLDAAPFCFQFCNLRFVQLFRHHLEPQINIFFIDFLVHEATFVYQRDNRLVFYTILNRVFMNQLAELLQGVLFVLQKRRAGKADVAGVREYRSHLGRERTVVRTVAFINKDKNIPGIVLDTLIIYRIELVDNRCNDVGLALVNQVAKVFAASRTCG